MLLLLLHAAAAAAAHTQSTHAAPSSCQHVASLHTYILYMYVCVFVCVCVVCVCVCLCVCVCVCVYYKHVQLTTRRSLAHLHYNIYIITHTHTNTDKVVPSRGARVEVSNTTTLQPLLSRKLLCALHLIRHARGVQWNGSMHYIACCHTSAYVSIRQQASRGTAACIMLPALLECMPELAS